MPVFSTTSKENLNQCHMDLQVLFLEVINHFDCKVIKGHRGENEQNDAYSSGHSKLKFPKSKHNKTPSLAADVMPYPINWNDRERMVYFAGFVLGLAKSLKEMRIIKHDVRWGGDWDQDTEVKDNSFDDLVHFELI